MLTLPSGYDEPYIEAWWEFESMEDCFAGRDQLLVDMGSYSGLPPKGTQLVCINNKKATNEKERHRRILGYQF